MKLSPYYCLYAFVCSLTSFVTMAQPPQVRATLDKTQAQIGDYIRLQLQAEYAANNDFRFPIFGKKWDSLTVIEVAPKDSTWLPNKRVKATQNVTLSAYKPGQYHLPPLTFSYGGTPNSLLNNIMTDSLFIEVVAPVVDPQADIKPIKTPMSVAPNNLPYWLLGASLLALLLGVVAGWRSRKKQAITQQDSTKIAPLAPHEIALTALQKLEQERLWQQQQVKPYYTRLTDILRQYLHQHYNIATAEATSDEILRDSQQHLNETQQQQLRQILTRADAVKFAKAEPPPQEHTESLEQTKSFVQQTQTSRRPPS